MCTMVIFVYTIVNRVGLFVTMNRRKNVKREQIEIYFFVMSNYLHTSGSGGLLFERFLIPAIRLSPTGVIIFSSS